MYRALAVVVLLICGHGLAYSDPVNLHIASTSHLVTSGGSVLDLPPGRFMDDQVYGKLDAEVKRLQDAERSLAAQNAVLRKSLDSWQPGMYTLVLTFATGIAAGIYLYRSL